MMGDRSDELDRGDVSLAYAQQMAAEAERRGEARILREIASLSLDFFLDQDNRCSICGQFPFVGNDESASGHKAECLRGRALLVKP